MARSDIVRIFVEVPEMESAQDRTRGQGEHLIQALAGQKIEGTVTRTSWALGPNRTLRTEMDTPNPEGFVAPRHVRHRGDRAAAAPRRADNTAFGGVHGGQAGILLLRGKCRLSCGGP